MPGGSLLDLIYPPACYGCGRSVESRERVLCTGCLEALVALDEDGCPRCGSPLESNEEGCPFCRRMGPALDSVRSAVWFMGPVPGFMHRFKYQGARRLAGFMAEMMSALPGARETVLAAEVLVPVPLHAWRRISRGYNQSAGIAFALARICGLDCAESALMRSRHTETQTRLNPEERRLNVDGAFRVKDNRLASGRTICLIDDVMTTGATLGACAAALKEAGAAKVLAYTFARA